MPKRPKRSEKASKGSEKASKGLGKGLGKDAGKGSGKDSGRDSGRDSGKDAGKEALPSGAAVDERGAFAIARCDRCGWQGAARRSRDRARKDLHQHLEDKPKHADHVSLTKVGG